MEYPHIVEVDLLGMTGIIVDRLLCRDVLADPSSTHGGGVAPPSPPNDMKVMAMVQQPSVDGTSNAGGSTPQQPSSGVSAVSLALQRSAGKEGIAGRVSGKQRYLALWDGAGRSGGVPSLVFETDLPRKGSTNGVDDKYTFSKKFDVHLLMLDSHTNETIPVGRAFLTLRPGMNGSQNHNLVVHPLQNDRETDSLPEGISSKPVYSVDPSARLRVRISVTERDGNPTRRGSLISRSNIPRVASKPVYSIEAIRTCQGTAPILVEDDSPSQSNASAFLIASNGICAFHEEKKEDNEVCVPISYSDANGFDEAFEVQEEEAIKICGAEKDATAIVDKTMSSARRPPKPPTTKKSPKRVPVPPPPPSTPPPKLRSTKNAGSPSTTARTSATASSTPDNSSVSSSSETLPFNNINAFPENTSSNEDLDATETESKTSTGSKASGSSFNAALMPIKPHVVSHHGIDEHKKRSKFQLQRRFNHPQIPAHESLSPQETQQAEVVPPAGNVVAKNGQTVESPVVHDPKDDPVRECPAPSIWTEQWADDGDETTMYTFRSDDDTRTFDTRQTSATYDYSQWGRAEKIMAMIPWEKIDSIVDRTKIDTLIDKIPIGTLSSLVAFASPAEFDEETCDNTSRRQDSAMDTVTDEGSFSTYRRRGSYDDDDTFIERHSSLFRAAGCWIPTVPASMRRAEPLVRRSSRFEPKFDLPEHFSAVAAVEDESTVDGASIAAASVSERKVGPSKQGVAHSSQATEPVDLDSLAPSSVNAEGNGSMFKSRKPPFKKPLDTFDAKGYPMKSSGPVVQAKLQTIAEHESVQASDMAHPTVVTPTKRLERTEPSSPFGRKADGAPFLLADASPMAVSEFPAPFPEATHIASITDLFQRKDKVDDESLIDAPSQPEIYVTVDDSASLGDLTMTTHELLLETAAGHRPGVPTPERPGTPGGRQDSKRSVILSFFTCGTSEGLCSASTAAPMWTRAESTPFPREVPPRSRLARNDPTDDDNSLHASSAAVPDEMRAAAEAAWAKRTAEFKRARPSWRKAVGYEI